MKAALGLIFLTSLCQVLVEPSAHADEASDAREAREHYKKGTKAYELGLYDEAIVEYAAAYKFRDDPALLYNLGQVHRLANHPTEAIHFYRMFLMKAPKSPIRREVQDKVAELQKLVDQQKRTQSLPPDSIAPPGSAQTEPTEPPPAEGKTTVPPSQTSEPPPATTSSETKSPEVARISRASKTKIIAGAAVAGGGVALIVGGIVSGVLANQASDKLTRLNQMHQPFDYNLEQTGKRDQIIEGVLLGVGAAAVVAGGTLAVLGYLGKRREQRSMAVVPLLSPSSAGLAWEGRF